MLPLLFIFSILIIISNGIFDLPSFPDGSPWTLDISNSTDINPKSDNITQWLESQGGWGLGRFQIDFSIVVLTADCSSIRIPVYQTSTYYSACDTIHEIPIPLNGALEGHSSWIDSIGCNGDCHLLIYDELTGLLYESFATEIFVNPLTGIPTNITTQCIVVWNTSYLYPANGRGDGCTSADAAGFPISTLLFTADELATNEINHAIRFILPNDRMRADYYIHPASHFGGPRSLSPISPIYGSRWRLKDSFDINDPIRNYSKESKVILRALKKYGMFLSDGGNVALTAMSDKFNTLYNYSRLGFGSRDMDDIVPTDFEIMNGFGDDAIIGPGRPDCIKNSIPINTTYDESKCRLNPINTTMITDLNSTDIDSSDSNNSSDSIFNIVYTILNCILVLFNC